MLSPFAALHARAGWIMASKVKLKLPSLFENEHRKNAGQVDLIMA